MADQETDPLAPPPAPPPPAPPPVPPPAPPPPAGPPPPPSTATYADGHTTNSFLAAAGAATFPFTSDADGFVVPNDSQLAQTWRNDEGLPPGCVQLALPVPGSSYSGQGQTVWTGTWQDLGAPAGATVTSVRMTQGLTRVTAVDSSLRLGGPPDSVVSPLTVGPYVLKNMSQSVTGTLWTGRDVLADTPDSGWVNAGQQPVVTRNEASSTQFHIALEWELRDANIADFLTDQINLTITYTTGGGSGGTAGRSLQLVWHARDNASICQPGTSMTGVGFIANNCDPCDGNGVSNSACNPASNGLKLIWDVDGPVAVDGCGKSIVCATLDLRWNGTTKVGRNLQTSWNVRQRAGNERRFPWDVKFGWPVGAEAQFLWNAAPAIWGNNLEVKWDALTTVGAETDLVWDAHEIVGAEQDFTWDAYEIVGAELESTWEITGSLGAELDVFYEVFIVVGQEVQPGWDVHVTVGSSLDLHWDVKQLAYQSFESKWDTYRLGGKSLATRWNVTQSAGVELETRWKTFLRGAAEVKLRWYVHEQTKHTVRDQVLLDKANANIADLLSRRGPGGGGFNPYRSLELYGGKVLEPLPFEPDPRTHRDEFYIHSRDNRVYRRVWDRYEPARGILVAHWAGISE